MHKQLLVQILIFSSLFFTATALCNPPPSFVIPSQVDFGVCYTSINKSTLAERVASGCFDGDGKGGILTYEGCVVLCGGDGYQTWPWKDVLNRLNLLVIPSLVLVARLAFPPLGWRGYLLVTINAFGNPIESLRNSLTRFERHRRLRRASHRLFGREVFADSLSVIWATYEELGWQDVSRRFPALLAEYPLTHQERFFITLASHNLASTRVTSVFSTVVAFTTLIGTLTIAILRTIKEIDQANTRVSNETAHTIAVVCLLFFIIPQVWFSARLGTFTTTAGPYHIINVMRISLNKLNSRDKRSGPLFPVIKLGNCPDAAQRPNRRATSWFRRHFSHRPFCCPLDRVEAAELDELHSGPQEPNEASQSLIADTRTLDCATGDLGYYSSWRPCKHLGEEQSFDGGTQNNVHGPGSTQIRTISTLDVVFGACITAYVISATNRANGRSLGIGCRSLSWIAVMVLWLLSAALDSFMKFICIPPKSEADRVKNIKKIWKWTVLKNALVACLVLILVLLVQIGRYNSCWCRASFQNIVTIFGYTAIQWRRSRLLWCLIPAAGLFINCCFIVLIEFWPIGSKIRKSLTLPSRERGSPLSKSNEDMEKELHYLEQLRERIEEFKITMNFIV